MSFNVFNLNEAADNPFLRCIRLIKISILYLFPVVSTGLFICFSWRGDSFPTGASHWLQVSASGGRQTRPSFYPVRQIHHVYSVDAEEGIQDFRPLRPDPDNSELIALLPFKHKKDSCHILLQKSKRSTRNFIKHFPSSRRS